MDYQLDGDCSAAACTFLTSALQQTPMNQKHISMANELWMFLPFITLVRLLPQSIHRSIMHSIVRNPFNPDTHLPNNSQIHRLNGAPKGWIQIHSLYDSSLLWLSVILLIHAFVIDKSTLLYSFNWFFHLIIRRIYFIYLKNPSKLAFIRRFFFHLSHSIHFIIRTTHHSPFNSAITSQFITSVTHNSLILPFI